MAATAAQLPPDDRAHQATKRLRAAMMQTASRFWWWRSSREGRGCFLENTNARPRPIRRTYQHNGRERTIYLASTPSRPKFHDHVFAGRPIFLTNRAAASTWHLVIDVDDDPTATTANAINAAIGGRGYISPSRSTGQHIHLRISRTPGEEPEHTIDRLSRLAAAIRGRHPQAEAIKGMPTIARRHGELLEDDQIDAASRELYHTNAPGTLGEIIDITHSPNANYMVPALARPGTTWNQRVEAVERFLDWHAGTAPIPLDQLEQIFGIMPALPQAAIITPAPARAAPAKPTPSPAGDIAKALDEEIAEDRAAEIARITGGRGTGKLAAMLMSTDKPTARNAAMLAAVQQVGISDYTTALSRFNSIYSSLPAAEDDILDGKRQRHARQLFDYAASTYNYALAGRADAYLAMIRQATSPARFELFQIDIDVETLPRLLAKHGLTLRHNTLRGLAIGLRTIRKDVWQQEHGIVTEKVRKHRERRGSTTSRPGAEVPTEAIEGMLGFFGLRNNGSAVREIFDIARALGAVVMTAEHKKCHYENRKKIADGEARCYRTGPNDEAVFAAGDKDMIRRRDKAERQAERTPAGGAASIAIAMFGAEQYRGRANATDPITTIIEAFHEGISSPYTTDPQADEQFAALARSFSSCAAF